MASRQSVFEEGSGTSSRVTTTMTRASPSNAGFMGDWGLLRSIMQQLDSLQVSTRTLVARVESLEHSRDHLQMSRRRRTSRSRSPGRGRVQVLRRWRTWSPWSPRRSWSPWSPGHRSWSPWSSGVQECTVLESCTVHRRRRR